MYKRFLTKKYIISAIVVLIIAGGIYLVNRNGDVDYEYMVVEKTDLVQEVNVTGKVKPAKRVDLAFESSGKINGIVVDIGDKVYSGQTLAYLNNAQYQAQYLQAQASLEAEQAKLEELKKGSRPEEVEIQKTKVLNAEEALQDAKINLKNYIKDAYTKADDAIRNRVDQFISNAKSSEPNLDFLSVYELEIESGRVTVENILTNWSLEIYNDLDILNDLTEQSDLAQQNLSKISNYLEIIALAVNQLDASSSLSQTTIDGYKADVATARTNTNTAINSLATAKEKLRTAQTNFALEKQQLELKQLGATVEQISAQEARVKSSEANVKNYGALIGKTIIYSPINGVVTKKMYEVGEIVQANTPVLSVISTADYEIETNVPEVDISKVEIGDIADVTLDAYEDDLVFLAHVTSIDPAETVIEGVSAYKTTLQFDDEDVRIKSGMTANIDIMTDSRDNVLAVSYRSIGTEGGKHVEVLKDDGTIEERLVETGMRSSDGMVEIISGLEEGEKVITSR